MTTNPYATWDEAIAAGRVTDDADGWPDRAMVPVVAELRRRGIVTLQSCAGHQGSDDGHLWTTQPLDVDTAALSLVRHVTHPEERWEFWWKPADRHRALEALLAARVTTNPTPAPAGAQPGSERASGAHVALTKALLSARWPDGTRDGFPTRKIAEMLADAVLASDWLATHVREQVDAALERVREALRHNADEIHEGHGAHRAGRQALGDEITAALDGAHPTPSDGSGTDG